MADNLNTTGVSTTTPTSQKDITIDDLAPNNYITIVWKDVNTGKVFNSIDYSKGDAYMYTNDIHNALYNSINNGTISSVGKSRYINIGAIGKYIAQNTFSKSSQKKAVNAIINIATGNPKQIASSTTNLVLNMFGGIADKTARSLGMSNPQDLFIQFAGEKSLDILKTLGDKTQDFIDDITSKLNNKKTTNVTSKAGANPKEYVGLLLGTTTSDTESYEITIPRRKVENGSNYTTHLLPQPFKKEINVTLTNKVLTPNYNKIIELEKIEEIKDKLIEIANSRTLFDVYFRLSNTKMYKKANVTFSSLSITKDEGTGNTYNVSFTLEPINEFKSKLFISTKKVGSVSSKTVSKTKSKGTGKSGKSGTTQRQQKNKTNTGKTLKVDTGGPEPQIFSSFQEALTTARENGRYLVVKRDTKSGQTAWGFVGKNKVVEITSYDKNGNKIGTNLALSNTAGYQSSVRQTAYFNGWTSQKNMPPNSSINTKTGRSYTIYK